VVGDAPPPVPPPPAERGDFGVGEVGGCPPKAADPKAVKPEAVKPSTTESPEELAERTLDDEEGRRLAVEEKGLRRLRPASSLIFCSVDFPEASTTDDQPSLSSSWPPPPVERRADVVWLFEGGADGAPKPPSLPALVPPDRRSGHSSSP
jgi:hypothetical protein